MKNIFGVQGFNFTTNDIFSGLSMIQIAIFFASVALAILVGLFIGACVFFPAGVKSCLKQIQKKKAEKIASQENQQMESFVTTEEVHKVVPTNLNYTDADYSIDDDDILDDDILDDEIIDDDILDDVELDGSDAKTTETVRNADVRAVLFEDKDFMALVEKRKKDVPVLSRNYLVNRIYGMNVLSEKINIHVNFPTEETPYVRVTAGDCTYLYIFVMKKVMKLFMRLHQVTYNSIKQKAGTMLEVAPKLGDDWYSLVVGDFPQAVSIATNAVELSYKYTAQKEFKNTAKGIEYVGTSYEAKVKAFADDYNPYEDESFVNIVQDLQSKYQLSYFGKSEACTYTRKIIGKDKATAIELVGNRPAILKAGESMFAILFENYGVSKLIFRNSEEYVQDLQTKHNYVKESNFPRSTDWKWYSLLIDSTYTDKEVKQIILDSYEYVVAYNEKAIENTDVDVDIM